MIYMVLDVVMATAARRTVVATTWVGLGRWRAASRTWPDGLPVKWSEMSYRMIVRRSGGKCGVSGAL
ncbi:hypothetical protein [Nonomuraea solani]|uniref:hypothetical protein n=1 Tax=Nonomuraea solani TaxID=1144553 RepID=UPI000CDF0A67|nr:hypothetical protein [Nonomuraea solani]